ncbi:MAG: amino acid permease [Reyranella sp.]|nr:amino acid permease [Reyranella sp.]
MNSLLARKSVSDIVGTADPRVPKVLGAVSIVAMGIGAIIGAGIFVLTGTVAALNAGPAIVISFVLAAIACGFVGLCYAELSALLPVSGSTYTYTYATLGELAAWVIGWDLILEYAMGSAAVAVGWSGYFNNLLGMAGLSLPARFAAATGQAVVLADGTGVTAIANLPAAAIVLLITVLLVGGTKESVRLNNIMVALKLTVIVAFIGLGAFYVQSTNWQPFIPENTGTFGSFGASGIMRGASIVFFTYIGFDAVSNCAQEAKRPQRDMPIGILGALGIATVLYIAVAAVLTGLVPYPQLNVPDPVAKGVRVIGYEWFSLFIELGALVGITTCILVLLYGQSRILATMANDGLMPPVVGRLHPRLGTPWISQITLGVVVATAAAVAPMDALDELVGVGTLFAFILVCTAVIYLRAIDPEVHRPFRVPYVPWVPLLGILSCLSLMSGLSPASWLRLVGWLAIGLVIYFTYSRHHSRLGRRHPTA